LQQTGVGKGSRPLFSERLPNPRPSSLRNSKDEELKPPKFSTATLAGKYGLTTNCDTSQPFALLPFPLPIIIIIGCAKINCL